ncbi:MAG: dTDP-4-dehydrorhamnose 3,5-epimerase [Deltaproteobacteria bacterium]|nr:MAG: dTDP-4-dehydrorhamnose 3,5-epimerase [Deltaproteobacteria bacterium]
MKIVPTALADVRLVEPRVHADDRGWLVESHRPEAFEALGLPAHFSQENTSLSHPGVLRGLHFQVRHPQGKLITVARGTIYDVAVDLRPGSPDRGRWVGVLLSAATPRMLWVPPGFAHGFYVTEGPAVVCYKLTAPYAPDWDRCLSWDDPTVGVRWPLQGPPILSERDRRGMSWQEALACLEGEAR